MDKQLTIEDALDRIKRAHTVSMACLGIEDGDIETKQAISRVEEELEKNYYAEAEKLHKCGDEKLKEGFDLLYKNFGDLWW